MLTDSSAQGLWMELSSTGLQKILTPQDVTPEGDRVGSFVNCCLTTNDVGDVGLRTDRGGIWIANADGELRRVVDHGQAAPEIDNGRFSSMESMAINKRGSAAFAATVIIFHGIASNNEPITTMTTGVWAEDADRQLQLIVKEGDLIDLDEGPGIDLQSLKSAEVLGFADFGRLALGFHFSESYGVFMSLPVPEPSTSLQSWLAAIGVAFRPARRGRCTAA
jgi:hypothetical protein